MQAFRFRPRLWPSLGTMALLALFVHLGNWQSDKGAHLAAQLEELAQRARLGPTRLDAALVDRQATQSLSLRVRGQFEPEQQFYVDNQQLNGVAGIHVVTPLKIEGSNTRVLVQRGWVGWGQNRQHLPAVTTPGGVVELDGMAIVPSNKKPWLVPDKAEAWPQLWPRLDLPRFASSQAYPVQPIVVVQTSALPADGLQRHWQPPEDKVGMHQSYALQWYGMALALVVFYGVVSLRRAAATPPAA